MAVTELTVTYYNIYGDGVVIYICDKNEEEGIGSHRDRVQEKGAHDGYSQRRYYIDL